MLCRLILTLLLCVSTSLSWASDQEEDPKYAGIEIVVNINQASAAELADLLSGVGEKKAQAIVDYRSENGDFSNTDDLVNVKGIGPALVEKNRSRIQL